MAKAEGETGDGSATRPRGEDTPPAVAQTSPGAAAPLPGEQDPVASCPSMILVAG